MLPQGHVRVGLTQIVKLKRLGRDVWSPHARSALYAAARPMVKRHERGVAEAFPVVYVLALRRRGTGCLKRCIIGRAPGG